MRRNSAENRSACSHEHRVSWVDSRQSLPRGFSGNENGVAQITGANRIGGGDRESFRFAKIEAGDFRLSEIGGDFDPGQARLNITDHLRESILMDFGSWDTQTVIIGIQVAVQAYRRNRPIGISLQIGAITGP